MIKIVALNSKYVHTLLSPYYLKENCDCTNIEILQVNVNQSVGELIGQIMIGEPRIIAFCCYIFNINVVVELSAKIRAMNSEVTIIYGGPEVSFDPQQYEYADHVICGEGELGFNNLINMLTDGQQPPKVITGELIDLNAIKSPYTEEYFRQVEGKIAYFEASRGCPFSCSYCMSGKSNLRKFDLGYVTSQLDKFAGKKVRVVKFVDRTFNADKKFAYAIIRHIIASPSLHHLSYHFEIGGDLIDEQLIQLLQQSPRGLFQFEIGVQSFNQTTLANVVRSCDTDKLKDNIKKIVAVNKCHIHTDLIAGLPHEDLPSLRESFNELYSLGGNMLQLGFLKLLKGSRLREEVDCQSGYEYNNNPPYEIISTPWISAEELEEVRLVEVGVDMYYNVNNFMATLRGLEPDDPYAFYLNLAKVTQSKDLFARYDALFHYLISLGHDEGSVRSNLTIDYVLSNNSRTLPPVLKVFDPTFKGRLASLGIDAKKYFCVEVSIISNSGNITNAILAMDYAVTPYKMKIVHFDK